MKDERRLYPGVLRIELVDCELPLFNYCWQPIYYFFKKGMWSHLDHSIVKGIGDFLGKDPVGLTGNYTVPTQLLEEIIPDRIDFEEVVVSFEKDSAAVASLPLAGELAEVFISSSEGGVRFSALVKATYSLRDGSGTAVILDIDKDMLPDYLGYGRRYNAFVLKHSGEWCVLLEHSTGALGSIEYAEVTDLDIMIMPHKRLTT